MRHGLLAAACVLAAAAPLHADEWTLIDVKTTLANDGRATVVETHDIVLATTGRNVFHDFGRGADQDIRLTAMTRIGPDHEPHPLKRVETVTGPDEFTYYELGHAYFSIPPLGEDVTVQYRLEYELVGAVAPAWSIAAGPGSRAPRDQELFWPWERIGQVVADWQRARPLSATRYRFDHDVLLPDREGAHTFRQIDYRLEYGTFWRDIAPDTDIGAPSQGAYRTARIFEYLGPGLPAQATTRPAAMRLASLLVLPIAGLAGWGLVVGMARFRRGPPIDRTFVETRFLTRAPEEIAYRLDGTRPAAADILARLAGEAAIGIRVDRPAGPSPEEVYDDDGLLRLHLRRVAADASLTRFERDLLDDLFGDTRELTTASHQQRHAGRRYDPDDAVERILRETTLAKAGRTADSTSPGGGWSPARAGLLLLFVGGLFGAFRYVGPLFDVVAVLAIWAFFTVAVVNAWPTGWWYPGRPVRGLLVPLVLLYVGQLTLLLVPNRPLPAEGWAASAIAVVAGYFLTLVRSRIPGGRGDVVTDLLRMRVYARDELQRPRPQLDDRWISRLRALGLGPAIEAWRARYTGASLMPPQIGDRPLITSAHFTGVAPAPWAGPKGWHHALTVYDDSEDDGEDEGEDDGEDEGDDENEVVHAAADDRTDGTDDSGTDRDKRS